MTQEQGFMGDVNQDGVLDHLDLALLKEVVQEYKTLGGASPLLQSLTPEQMQALDINGDGKLTYDDVVLLCKQLIETPASCDAALEQANYRFTLLRHRLNQV